ncbi:MAG: hypothetical protein EXS42_02650 [Lacunisphaera sp.]|nr:hypothetical protein [Lacunisphaera sp.]
MATRLVLGGDFRTALNALTHGDEEGIAQFLPYRKGATGLHLAEAIGLIGAGLPRADQLALAKAITKEQTDKLESGLRTTVPAALDWFKDDKTALLQHLSDGGTYERYSTVLNDHAREAIAVRLISAVLKVETKAESKSSEAAGKKGGFFSRLFRKA